MHLPKADVFALGLTTYCAVSVDQFFLTSVWIGLTDSLNRETAAMNYQKMVMNGIG